MLSAFPFPSHQPGVPTLSTRGVATVDAAKSAWGGGWFSIETLVVSYPIGSMETWYIYGFFVFRNVFSQIWSFGIFWWGPAYYTFLESAHTYMNGWFLWFSCSAPNISVPWILWVLLMVQKSQGQPPEMYKTERKWWDAYCDPHISGSYFIPYILPKTTSFFPLRFCGCGIDMWDGGGTWNTNSQMNGL